ALGGVMYVPTVMVWGGPRLAILGCLTFGLTSNTVSCVPDPQMSGHSMSEEATTHPRRDGSIWIAGTGVKAIEPSSFRRSVNFPVPNLLASGQVVMGSGRLGLLIHSRAVRSACISDKLV